MNTTLKDSLIKLYKVNQSDQDTIINHLQFENQELTTKIEEDEVELKKRRKNVFKSGIGGFVGGLVTAFIILLKH